MAERIGGSTSAPSVHVVCLRRGRGGAPWSVSTKRERAASGAR
jgi:hypothetical protein